ncbi:MAG TPA: SCO family protein [Bacteroidia bacterium]|jgi:protein SCO1/2|nr:SCO family protein [Bacteroidia bacterium]
MSSSKPNILNIILFLGAIVVLVAAFMLSKSNKPIRLLPIYGSKEYDPVKKDTDYHTVLDFKLTDQMGHTITLDSFKHKVFVANFFYASCPGICKKMNNELEKATKSFAGDPYVKFVSYTVDPARDTVAVLANYAKNHDAIPYQWYFLTGDKKEIYNLALKSYFAAVDDSAGNNFIHTQNMALVDTAGHLRGFYSGTDSTEVNRMIVDINLLLKEENLYKK